MYWTVELDFLFWCDAVGSGRMTDGWRDEDVEGREKNGTWTGDAHGMDKRPEDEDEGEKEWRGRREEY